MYQPPSVPWAENFMHTGYFLNLTADSHLPNPRCSRSGKVNDRVVICKWWDQSSAQYLVAPSCWSSNVKYEMSSAQIPQKISCPMLKFSIHGHLPKRYLMLSVLILLMDKEIVSNSMWWSRWQACPGLFPYVLPTLHVVCQTKHSPL